MRALFFILALLSACVPDTSRETVAVTVLGRGIGAHATRFGDYDVSVVEARVAVGPLYFCSAAHASDRLCRSARLALVDPFVVDLLDDSPREGGIALGTTGRVSSTQFDLGRSFLPTRTHPEPGTSALGGRSAVIVIDVDGPSESFTVELLLSLDPPRAGSSLVLGARTTADVTSRTASVTLGFEALALVDSIDFARLEDEVAETETDMLRPGPGSQAYEAVALRLTEGQAPTFVWMDR